MKAVSVRIEGRVQGVCFRMSAEESAARLAVAGIVRNEDDGSVYAEAEGPDEAVDRFVDWCRRGPRFAHVTRVTVQARPPAGYRDFTVTG